MLLSKLSSYMHNGARYIAIHQCIYFCIGLSIAVKLKKIENSVRTYVVYLSHIYSLSI